MEPAPQRLIMDTLMHHATSGVDAEVRSGAHHTVLLASTVERGD
jgi:hypothetical protein